MDAGFHPIGGFKCDRAFKRGFRAADLALARAAAGTLWGGDIAVLDPMAGGGSIPLESARLGFDTVANEYNPVACSVLEATVDYPFRFGRAISDEALKWGRELRNRFNRRIQKFFPNPPATPRFIRIFARTVPCPDTQLGSVGELVEK